MLAFLLRASMCARTRRPTYNTHPTQNRGICQWLRFSLRLLDTVSVHNGADRPRPALLITPRFTASDRGDMV